MAAESTLADADARRALKADLARAHCRVQQPDDPPLFTREPRSPMQPVHWRWADLQPLLERIGAQITLGAGGPRRTLRLANPGLEWGTTPTFWASIQVILPGELADAHRHTASAFRFVMKGSGCQTTVDGERYPMNEGDLVLTPAWAWHDHEHFGKEPMIWLDVLDVSLMKTLHATFFDPYTQPQQVAQAVPEASYRALGSGLMRPPRKGPPTQRLNPLLAYPRAQAEAALAQAAGLPADPFDDVILEYQNPVNGGPAMTTLAMSLQTLRPGFRGQALRHTGCKLYHVVSGQGSSIVAGQRFDWGAGDFFVVPPWAWCEHHNASGGDARLFRVDDTPVLNALGYYREEALQDNGGHQPIESVKTEESK